MKTKFIFLVLFAISISAFSQINSYDIYQTIIGPGTLSFDLNDDGLDDFSFEIITLSPDVLAARVLTIGNSTMLDNSTFGYPDALNEGISVSGYFNTGIGVLGTFTNAGQFNGAGNKYLGVKINSFGNDYLGWIYLNCSANRDTLSIISCGYNTEASASINAGQTSVTAINETKLNAENFISVYPNPFSSLAILQTSNQLHNATLRVYNCFGQTVKQINNISGQTVTLSRDNLQSGMYFLSLTIDNEVIATKNILITD